MANIVRVYDTHQKASDAAAALKEKGFTDSQVAVTETPDGTAAVEAAPPFGRGAEAEAVLNSFGPIAAPAAATAAQAPASAWPAATLLDNAAPLSTALGLSVLTSFESGITLTPDPAPLSSKFGWKILSTDKPKAELMPDWTLSSKFGWKLLADTPATDDRKLLSDDPSPLSRAIGWPLLSKDPTPLSSKFGWKVLSDRQ